MPTQDCIPLDVLRNPGPHTLHIWFEHFKFTLRLLSGEHLFTQLLTPYLSTDLDHPTDAFFSEKNPGFN